MDIEIRHCNNIERARITLTADKLNIKFAPQKHAVTGHQLCGTG